MEARSAQTPEMRNELRRLRAFEQRAKPLCEACRKRIDLVSVETKKGIKKGVRCMFCRNNFCFGCARVHFTQDEHQSAWSR